MLRPHHDDLRSDARPPSRRRRLATLGVVTALGAAVGVVYQATAVPSPSRGASAADHRAEMHAVDLVRQGRDIFRNDTFGDQAFWGGTLRLHRALAGKKNGGVGPGVSPKTALAVGLKVDVTRLPRSVRKAIKKGQVDLNDPATTMALLKLNSVVGVKGFFDSDGGLVSV